MAARFPSRVGLLLLLLASVPAVSGQDTLDTLEKTLAQDTTLPSVLLPSDRGNGYLGMSVDLVAPEGKSVYVSSVADGGPAAEAGLRANDVIVSINRQPIGGLEDLDRLVRRPVGTKLELQVRRAGALQEVQLKLGERPSEGAPMPAPESAASSADELPPPPPPAGVERAELPAPPASDEVAPRTEGGPSIIQGSRPTLGISVADISELTKRRFGVTVDTGAVISQIREGTPAALAGLPLGGVIISINGRRIGSANDVVEMIQAFRPGDQVEVTYFEGDRVGRKTVRLGRSAVAVVPDTARGTPDGERAAPSEPPLRLGRHRGEDRPLLDVLERTLDAVLPPPAELPSGGDVGPPPAPGPGAPDSETEMTPPPPPPPARREADVELPAGELEPPTIDVPAAPVDVKELDAKELSDLRRQAESLQKQLETLLKRIEQLEKTEASPPAPGRTTRR